MPATLQHVMGIELRAHKTPNPGRYCIVSSHCHTHTVTGLMPRQELEEEQFDKMGIRITGRSLTV